MSTQQTQQMPQTAQGAPRIPLHSQYQPAASTSFMREVGVEFRKMWDTRAALIVGIVGLVIAILYAVGMGALMGFGIKQMQEMAGSAGSLPTLMYADLVAEASKPMMAAVAVLAILTFTQEFGQRTALTTFVLQPRRLRVLGSKLVVVVTTSILVGLLSYPLGALMFTMVKAMGVTSGISWSIGIGEIAGFILICILTGLLGSAFALLTLSTVWAMVLYFVLPLVVNMAAMLSELSKGFAKVFPWISPNFSHYPLISDKAMSLTQWGQLGVSQLLWIGVPMAFGIWRWMRTNVN